MVGTQAASGQLTMPAAGGASTEHWLSSSTNLGRKANGRLNWQINCAH